MSEVDFVLFSAPVTKHLPRFLIYPVDVTSRCRQDYGDCAPRYLVARSNDYCLTSVFRAFVSEGSMNKLDRMLSIVLRGDLLLCTVQFYDKSCF